MPAAGQQNLPEIFVPEDSRWASRAAAFGAGMGIIMAMLSAVFWLFALPVLPIWSLVIVAIDVLIIYGLTAHGDAART
jgi:hypothetical protein